MGLEQTILLTETKLELELSCIYAFVSTRGTATNPCIFTSIIVTGVVRSFGDAYKV